MLFPRVRVSIRYISFSLLWIMFLWILFLQSYAIENIKAIQDVEKYAHNAVPALTENMKSTERPDYSELKPGKLRVGVGVTPEPTPSPTNRPTLGPTPGSTPEMVQAFPVPSEPRGGAAICAIQKGAKRYLDEWTDYNLAMGFDRIYLYDNSDDFELKEWAQNKERIHVKHYPGFEKQMIAYTECGQWIQYHKMHSWIAFMDTDEFVVIRDTNKFPYIMDFLNTVPLDAAGLAINWQMFGFNNHTNYEPKPLLLRFQKHEPEVDQHIKTIARARDFKSSPNPHFVDTLGGHKVIDTSGNVIKGPFNPLKINDKIVIFHIHTKSLEEYKERCKRGRATTTKQKAAEALPCKPYSDEQFMAHFKPDTIMDGSAWKLLKERVPKYAKFED